jgi:hypothetical protein
VPRLHLLGHGDLSCMIFANGSSAMTWKGLDVTRFREDTLLEPSGIFVYVRDLTRRRMWSAGQQPVGQAPDYYDASFSIDRAELKRRDDSIETVMEVVVSPELPAEVRRITLTNHGRQACELDITSYCEAVLAPRGADVAHRAFSSMFLETELIRERGAILVRRRPRSAHEQEVWMVQVLSTDSEGFGEPELDSSRVRFLGRAGSLQKPRAMHDGQVLAGSAGHVLDALGARSAGPRHLDHRLGQLARGCAAAAGAGGHSELGGARVRARLGRRASGASSPGHQRGQLVQVSTLAFLCDERAGRAARRDRKRGALDAGAARALVSGHLGRFADIAAARRSPRFRRAVQGPAAGA